MSIAISGIGDAGDFSSAIAVPPNGVPVGDHVIVVVWAGDDAGGTPAVSDSRGNSYMVDASSSYSGRDTQIVVLRGYVATALVTGDTISVVPNVGSSPQAYAYVLTGASESPLDAYAQMPGTNSAEVATTENNDLLFSAAISNTGGISPGAGFTGLPAAGENWAAAACYCVAGSKGAYPCTWAYSGTTSENGILVAYKAAYLPTETPTSVTVSSLPNAVQISCGVVAGATYCLYTSATSGGESTATVTGLSSPAAVVPLAPGQRIFAKMSATIGGVESALSSEVTGIASGSITGSAFGSGASLTNAGAQSLSGAAAALSFTTASFDTGAYSNIGSHPTRLTVTATGLYRVNGWIAISTASLAGNHIVSLGLAKNGVAIPDGFACMTTAASSSTVHYSLAVNALLLLAAGDHIEIQFANADTVATVAANASGLAIVQV